MRAIRRIVPSFRQAVIFESSPGGPASAKLAKECEGYVPSQFFDDVPSGQFVAGVRREDLTDLTLDSSSVDVVITQDVLEHIINPVPALNEIARVLRRDGCHIFTVPIFDRPRTVVRVGEQGELLMAPDYHGNPIGDGRSLVVREWGNDIIDFIDGASPTETQRINRHSWVLGLRGEMMDVFVSRRRANSIE